MLKNKIIHSPYIKKVATLFSATFIGQLIPFAFYPILSRIYSPEDYSELGLFILAASVISMIGTLKLDQSLLIPDSDEDAIALSKRSTLCLTVISSIAFLGLYFGLGYTFTQSFLIFGGAQFLGLASIYLQLSNRLNYNKTISIHKVSLGTGVSFFQLALNSFTYGLIKGKVIGDFIAITPFIYRFHKVIWKTKPASLAGIWLKYKGFILVTLPHNLFNIVGNRLPVLVFAYLGYKNLSGEYENVYRLGMAPITIISQSLYLSFSARFAEIHRNNQNPLYFLLKNIKWITLALAIPFLIVIFFAPTIIPFFLGEQWINSGRYFLLLSPIMISTLLASPFVYIPQYFQKQAAAFSIEVLINILKTVGLVIGISISTNWAVFLFASFGAIGHCIFMIYNYNLIKNYSHVIK